MFKAQKILLGGKMIDGKINNYKPQNSNLVLKVHVHINSKTHITQFYP